MVSAPWTRSSTGVPLSVAPVCCSCQGTVQAALAFLGGCFAGAVGGRPPWDLYWETDVMAESRRRGGVT